MPSQWGRGVTFVKVVGSSSISKSRDIDILISEEKGTLRWVEIEVFTWEREKSSFFLVKSLKLRDLTYEKEKQEGNYWKYPAMDLKTKKLPRNQALYMQFRHIQSKLNEERLLNKTIGTVFCGNFITAFLWLALSKKVMKNPLTRMDSLLD